MGCVGLPKEVQRSRARRVPNDFLVTGTGLVAMRLAAFSATAELAARTWGRSGTTSTMLFQSGFRLGIAVY
jgi:hypothetical protein